jgi:hypothetical protein
LTTDEKLDEALKQTFPASDPFAVSPEQEPDSEAARPAFPCFLREEDARSLDGMDVAGFLDQLLRR